MKLVVSCLDDNVLGTNNDVVQFLQVSILFHNNISLN